jgi:hypothetical protein
VIGKALSHLVSSETRACLDEPTHEWIPIEQFPTSAYIKSEKLGFGKKTMFFQKKKLFPFCQSEKTYVFYFLHYKE